MKRPEQGGKAAIVRRTKRQPDMCACARDVNACRAVPLACDILSYAEAYYVLYLAWDAVRAGRIPIRGHGVEAAWPSPARRS